MTPKNGIVETAEPGVYAIGDIVAGMPWLAHAKRLRLCKDRAVTVRVADQKKRHERVFVAFLFLRCAL